MGKQRIIYLDFAKFLAITLVCIGHAYYFGDELQSKIRPIIYSFHMSLFMTMCGFFSHSSFLLPFKNFLIKKCKQLLVPSVVGSLLLAAIAYTNGGGYMRELYGGVWFLKCLFACYIVVYISKKVIHNDAAACAISSIVMLAIPYGGSLMINYYLLFFWTGYFLRKHYQWYDKHTKLITFLSLIVFTLLILLGKGHAVDKVTLQTIISMPTYIVMEYIVGLAGSMLCLGICKTVCSIASPSKMIDELSNIGKYTLGIYVVQIFVLERLAVSIPFLQVSEIGVLEDLVILPIIGIVFTFISYYIVKCTANMWWINNLFYGGQYSQ